MLLTKPRRFDRRRFCAVVGLSVAIAAQGLLAVPPLPPSPSTNQKLISIQSTPDAAAVESLRKRPAFNALKAYEEEQARSPIEQIFGLEGGPKRSFMFFSIWLLVGTLYYRYTGFVEEVQGTTLIASFYYAVQSGLSIGFGILTPKTEEAMVFTALYILSGAALAADALSNFITDSLDNIDNSRLGLVVKDEPSASALQFGSLLVLWWSVGTCFGYYHEGWSLIRSFFFAISATSTSGMQGLDSKDDASLLFCAIYSLLGVPLYAAAIGRLGFLIAQPTLTRRRSQIKERATRIVESCDLECAQDLFEMFDADKSGTIESLELINVIKFMAISDGMVVTHDDISFFLKEFDSPDGRLSKKQFLATWSDWQKSAPGPQQD